MKTPIILTMLLIITFLSSNSQSISISKENSSDPSNVCHNSTYKYVTAISDWQTGYSVAWIKTNADVLSQSTSEADVKWIAGSESDGYIGTLKAQIIDSNEKVVATSNTITVTIKSIKHIQPEIAGYSGGVLTIDPCNPGSLDLESTQIVVPGTGSINPEKVFNFKWTIPKGWTLNGQTSDGSTELGGDQAVTVYYPASAQGGTIKVRGYHSVSRCGDLQHSKYSESITVKREINFSLGSSKEYLICGDTNPVTYTVTPTSSCAVYYWNNSTTPTTNNTFQLTPDGTTDPIVTVKIVYAGKEVVKSKTIEYRAFPPGEEPDIEGPATVCMSGTSYFIPNIPSDYTITWETSSRVSRTSPQGANPCVFKASGSGSFEWIEATVSDECGNVVELDRRNVSTVWPSGVWVQNGQSHPLYTVNFVNFGSWIQAELACPTLTGSNWVMTSGSGINWNQSFYAGYSYLNLYLNTSNSYGDFRVNLYTDNCGTISPTYHFVPGYMYAFSMSPNPASDEVVISRIDAEQVFEQNVLKPKKEKYKEKVIANLDLGDNSFKDIKFGMKEPEEYTIRLFNEKQGLIKLIKTKSEKQEIDLRHLPSGTYFLHIENDYVLYQEQLIIRR